MYLRAVDVTVAAAVDGCDQSSPDDVPGTGEVGGRNVSEIRGVFAPKIRFVPKSPKVP